MGGEKLIAKRGRRMKKVGRKEQVMVAGIITQLHVG